MLYAIFVEMVESSARRLQLLQGQLQLPRTPKKKCILWLHNMIPSERKILSSTRRYIPTWTWPDDLPDKDPALEVLFKGGGYID
jgi:hypothetical protein